MNVREYQAEDLNDLHRPGDKSFDAQSILMRHGSFIRTVEVEGGVAAVFGMVVRWPGVADCWAVVGDHARGRGIFVTKAARALMHQFAQELKLHRVGVIVRADNKEYGRWAKALGFEFEGIEEAAASDGTDIHRYKWLHKWATSSVAEVHPPSNRLQ